MPGSRRTTPTGYKAAFIRRIRDARKAIDYTQERMAQELGVPQDQYKHYEKRTILPHHLIPAFCKITGFHPWFILTGQPAARCPGGSGVSSIRPAQPKKTAARS